MAPICATEPLKSKVAFKENVWSDNRLFLPVFRLGLHTKAYSSDKL